MFTKLSCAAAALVSLLGMTSVSFGSILPLLTGPSANNTLRDDNTFGGVGFEFTVGATDLTVVAVGVWDYLGDGSAPYDIPVNLTGAATASFSVPADPGHTLTFDEPDGFRYVTVTPFTLLAGQTYDLEANYANAGGELWRDAGAVTSSTFDAAPLITAIVATFGAGSQTTVGGSYSGPEFLVVIPEPASLTMMGALGCLALLRRRRA